MIVRCSICLLLILLLPSCGLFKTTPPTATVPDWLLVPVPVNDVMPQNPTMRDAVAQALEYRRALNECSVRLDYIKDLQPED